MSIKKTPEKIAQDVDEFIRKEEKARKQAEEEQQVIRDVLCSDRRGAWINFSRQLVENDVFPSWLSDYLVIPELKEFERDDGYARFTFSIPGFTTFKLKIQKSKVYQTDNNKNKLMFTTPPIWYPSYNSHRSDYTAEPELRYDTNYNFSNLEQCLKAARLNQLELDKLMIERKKWLAEREEMEERNRLERAKNLVREKDVWVKRGDEAQELANKILNDPLLKTIVEATIQVLEYGALD